jgi:hypothetical protein
MPTVQVNLAAPVADNGAPVTGYVVQRQRGAGSFTTLATPTTMPYQDTTTLASDQYRVAAVNAIGTGPYSAPALFGTGGGVGGTAVGLPAAKVGGPSGNWTVAYADDFVGSSIDTTKWVVANGQYQQNKMTPRAANVSVANSVVTLQLSTIGADAWTTDGAQIHSGKHNNHPWDSSGPYHAPVGSYVEARCWFPGNGTNLYNWPAFWTCGEGWATAGEHDVAEVLTLNAGVGAKMYGVYWNNVGGTNQGTQVYGPLPGYIGDSWHVFGVHRKPTSADYYYDGVQVGTIATADNGLAHAIVLTCGRSTDQTPVTGAAGAVRFDWVRSWVPA